MLKIPLPTCISLSLAGNEVTGTIHGWHQNRFILETKSPSPQLNALFIDCMNEKTSREGGGIKSKRTRVSSLPGSYLGFPPTFMGSTQEPPWIAVRLPELFQYRLWLCSPYCVWWSCLFNSAWRFITTSTRKQPPSSPWIFQVPKSLDVSSLQTYVKAGDG